MKHIATILILALLLGACTSQSPQTETKAIQLAAGINEGLDTAQRDYLVHLFVDSANAYYSLVGITASSIEKLLKKYEALETELAIINECNPNTVSLTSIYIEIFDLLNTIGGDGNITGIHSEYERLLNSASRYYEQLEELFIPEFSPAIDPTIERLSR